MRAVRLFTGADGVSHVEEIDLPTRVTHARTAQFAESPPGSALDWHTAPQRQYVVTLVGTLEFTTRDGEVFTLRPGEVLLAEDVVGTGHRWRLIDDHPWRRLYLALDPA